MLKQIMVRMQKYLFFPFLLSRLHARENAQSKVCITGLMETQVLDVKALVDVSIIFYVLA